MSTILKLATNPPTSQLCILYSSLQYSAKPSFQCLYRLYSIVRLCRFHVCFKYMYFNVLGKSATQSFMQFCNPHAVLQSSSLNLKKCCAGLYFHQLYKCILAMTSHAQYKNTYFISLNKLTLP